MVPSGVWGVGVSFRKDLALGSCSQTPGQEPMGPCPASLLGVCGTGGGGSMCCLGTRPEGPRLWELAGQSTACLRGGWE